MSALQVVALASLLFAAVAWARVSPWMKVSKEVGRALSTTGGSLGEAITPVWVYRRIYTFGAIVLVSGILVFFAFAWYAVIPAVVLAFVAGQVIGTLAYPRDPMDPWYLSPLIAAMEARAAGFRRRSDALRAGTASELAERLRLLRRGEDPTEHGGEIANDRRRALAAVVANRQGALADASLALLTALMTSYPRVGDDERRRDILRYASAALVRYLGAPAEDRAKFEAHGASLEEIVTELSDTICDLNPNIPAPADDRERLMLIRAVAAVVQDPFNAPRLEELLADAT